MKINKHATNGVNRRNFLKTGATSAFVVGSGLWVGRREVQANVVRRFAGRARNIIFLVSDGMSTGTLTMAAQLMHRKDGRKSHWMSLYEENRARRSLMDMAALDSIVTDSAAAASSWGCGYRVNNNSVNMGPEGEEYPPILPLFSNAGKSTGLVTTTTITHATPAGFAANVPFRQMEEIIAEQYLDRRIDVLLGGGNRFFEGGDRSDGRDLYQHYADAGYEIVRTKAALNGTPEGSERLLGIFSDGHLPYTLDHLHTPELTENVPSLAEMTEVALRRLSRNANGFILQVEGGRVDHGAHGNDIGAVLYDQIAFDDAIGTALAFAENDENTLVIITTDHGNANPGLNGTGNAYAESNGLFDNLQNFRHTNNWILRELNEESTVEEIIGRVRLATNLEIRQSEAATLRESMVGEYEPVYRVMGSPSAVMGQILANYTAVNFIGGAHTSDFVELAAFGPGSEAINGFVVNTDLFGVMMTAAGVEAG